MQLRSSSNQSLDLSTLFICCKLEDDSWTGQTADVGVGAAATGDWRAGVDSTGFGKKAAVRGGATAAVLRPRDDGLTAALDKEVRYNTIITVTIIVFIEQLTNRNHNSIDWHAGRNNKA